MDLQPNILLETAANECKKGDFKQGIHLYSQYIQLKKSDPKAYYQRGKAYFQIKDFNAAISDLNKAMALAPNDPHLTGERGLIYFMAKKEELAMNDFDFAVTLDPQNPFRYASRAFIKDRLNDLDGAKEDYQKALELDPDDAISYNNLGLVLDKMGRRKQAEKHFEQAAEIDPKNFGMRQKEEKKISKEVVPQLNDEKNKNDAVSLKREKVGRVSLIRKTLKSLITSKSEREEFWSFVKRKLS